MSRDFQRPPRLAVLLASLLAGAAHATSPTADCEAAAPFRTLRADTSGVADARAVWLDATTLRWPGKPPGASLRLVRLRPGTAALGAASPASFAEALPLQDATATGVPRPAWLAAGAERTVAAVDSTRLDRWYGADVLLVETGADGRVVDATRLQHALALDDRYAAAATIDDLGSTPMLGARRFRVWAPTAEAVSVCLYPDDAAPAVSATPLARDAATGAWD